MVTWLEPLAARVDDTLQGGRHPNRPHLDRLLDDPSDESAWQALRDDYDHQAPEWAGWANVQGDYDLALRVALERVGPRDVAIEVGAGSDDSSLRIEGAARVAVLSDVSFEMISRNPGRRRICCDVRLLPLREASVDLICGLNAVPHLPEFARVLRPGGVVVWAASFGPETPMYVAPERLEAQAPPGWTVTAQRVDAGEWCLLEVPA